MCIPLRQLTYLLCFIERKICETNIWKSDVLHHVLQEMKRSRLIQCSFVPPPSRLLQDENQTLLDQLRELKDENGRLFKLLSEKDFEIKHLKKKREEERLAFAGIKIPDICTTEYICIGYS